MSTYTNDCANYAPKEKPAPEVFEAEVCTGITDRTASWYKTYGTYKQNPGNALCLSDRKDGSYFELRCSASTADFATPAERERFEHVKAEVEHKGQKFEGECDDGLVVPEGKKLAFAGEWRKPTKDDIVVSLIGYSFGKAIRMERDYNSPRTILALVDDPEYKPKPEHVAGERCDAPVNTWDDVPSNTDHFEYTGEYCTISSTSDWFYSGYTIQTNIDKTSVKYWILRPVPKQPQFRAGDWVVMSGHLGTVVNTENGIVTVHFDKPVPQEGCYPESHLRPARRSDFEKDCHGVKVLAFEQTGGMIVSVSFDGCYHPYTAEYGKKICAALGVQIAPAGLGE